MPIFLLVVAVISFVLGAILSLVDETLGELDASFLLFLGLACWAASALPHWSRQP